MEEYAKDIAKAGAKRAARKGALAVARNPWVLGSLALAVLLVLTLVAGSLMLVSGGATQTDGANQQQASAVTVAEAGIVDEDDLQAFIDAAGAAGVPWQVVAVLGANSSGGAGTVIAGVKQGELISIPEQYGNGGYTVTYYGPKGFLFHGKWQIASGSDQNTIHNAWKAAGARYEDGIAVLDGRYLVATTSKFGKVGDLVNFYLEDGTEILAVVGDSKCETCNEPDVNEWGHNYGQTVIEFEVDKQVSDTRGPNPGNPAWKAEWGSKRVVAGANMGPHPAMNSNVYVSTMLEEAARQIGDKVGEQTGQSHSLTPLQWAAGRDGYKYVWGAEGPDAFDCSGLVKAAFAATLGIDVPHSSAQQYVGSLAGHGRKVHWETEADLQAGDLLFSPGHVAFYAGEGKVFHAMNPSLGVGFSTFNPNSKWFHDAVRVDGTTSGPVEGGQAATAGDGSVLPGFSGGKGPFHLQANDKHAGIPESEGVGAQAAYVARLLAADAPGSFGVDVVLPSGDEPYLDSRLADEEKQVKAGWVKAIVDLPIASMDEQKASQAYDAAKAWAMGDLNLQGMGGGEQCTVTDWDTSLLENPEDLETAFAGETVSPGQVEVAAARRILDATRQSLPVMRQKALLAAMWARGDFSDDAVDELAGKAATVGGATSGQIARSLGGQAAVSHMPIAEGILQAASRGTLQCATTTGGAWAGEVHPPVDVPGYDFRTCSKQLSHMQVRGPRSCSICRYLYHYGQDYGKQCGVVYAQTPQYAVVSGTVDSVAAGAVTYHGQAGGETVWIVHCHLISVDVKPGDAVSAGQQIGITGITGVESAGPDNAHAHIEVWPGHAPRYTRTSADGNGAVDANDWIISAMDRQSSAAAPAGEQDPKAYARAQVLERGWSEADYQALVKLWTRESSWNPAAVNAASGACGIAQALPCSKMASHGADYRTNPKTQIDWGLDYIKGRYGTPTEALGHSYRFGWY